MKRALLLSLLSLLSEVAAAQPAGSSQYLLRSGGKMTGALRVRTVTIAADDTTPSVKAGNVFTTSANTGATTITDLDDPHVDQVVFLCGGSSVNASTISDAGNFALNGNVTLNDDTCITLWVKADNDYVELGRTVAGGWVGTATSTLDMDGNDIVLDPEGDDRFELGTNDQLSLYIDGAEEYRWTASAFSTSLNSICLGGVGSTTHCINRSTNAMTFGPIGGVSFSFDTSASDQFTIGVTSIGRAGYSFFQFSTTDGPVVLTNSGKNSNVPLLHDTHVEAHATSDTLTDDESNSMHVNAGASGVITFTLPAAAAGICFDVAVNDTDDLKILAGSGDVIRIGATASAAAGFICMTEVGDAGRLCAIDTDTWLATGSFVGTAPTFDTGC